MTEIKQIYKCEICGNIVEVLHTGAGTLVCCNQPMTLLDVHDKDEAYEKHLPVLSFEGNTLTVTIGEVEHPMEEAHYIEWIEYIEGEESQKVFLKPNEKPEAVFIRKNNSSSNYSVRAYCNIHGLWELKM